MSGNRGYKEVCYDKCCKTCKHFNKKEKENPCFECLNNPVNLYSHKPMKYEEDKRRKERRIMYEKI